MKISSRHAFAPSPLAIRFRSPPAQPSRGHQLHMCSINPRPAFRSSSDRAKDFLTQRAVQQTMFCSRVLRDETTLRWLEDWLDHQGLDDLHHCDALRVSSTEYLNRLFKEPPVLLHIRKPIPGRTTNKNPYLQRRYFQYDVEIVPRQIGLRILDARKQIAAELITDIPCVASENERLLQLYRKRVLQNDPSPLTADMLTMPTNGDRRGSPFRNANFDLVKNYTIYLGLYAAIRELDVRGEKEDAEWLKKFIEEQGEQLMKPYGGELGTADAVVEELLAASPTVRPGKAALFDPRKLAEMVLEQRTKCAEEWLQVMRDADEDQLDLGRRLLEDEL